MLGRVAILCCAVAPLCWLAACAPPSKSPPLADADRAAIAALDSASVDGCASVAYNRSNRIDVQRRPHPRLRN